MNSENTGDRNSKTKRIKSYVMLLNEKPDCMRLRLLIQHCAQPTPEEKKLRSVRLTGTRTRISRLKVERSTIELRPVGRDGRNRTYNNSLGRSSYIHLTTSPNRCSILASFLLTSLSLQRQKLIYTFVVRMLL